MRYNYIKIARSSKGRTQGFDPWYPGSSPGLAAKNMNIYLLRHTESTSNKNNKADSQIDADLSSKGLSDAQKLIPVLNKINPDIFFRSPLKRTYQTLEPFLDTLEDPTVIADELLLERDLGDFTGTPMGTFQEYCDKNGLDKVTHQPTGGESIQDVYERTKKFLSKLNDQYYDKSIVVCGSKNSLMCLEVAITKKDIKDFSSFEPFAVGELREFKSE